MRHPSLIPLAHDHHHGLALALRCRKQALGQLKPLGVEGLRERSRELRDFFSTHLVDHFHAEEQVLFPRMRGAIPESEPIIEQLLQEHQQIRSAMPKLEADAGLGKLIFDLGDLLERHIRKEERELFPLFERHAREIGAEIVGGDIKKILAARSAD